MHMAPCIFQLSASLLLTLVLVHSGAIPCKDKGIEWRLLNVNQVLVFGNYPSFLFMLLVDLPKGLSE